MMKKINLTTSSVAVKWQNNKLFLLDQRLLPKQEIFIEYDGAETVAQAITDMVVRGAPAIGVTAAYGVALSAIKNKSLKDGFQKLKKDMQIIAASRPTAINLMWAVSRMGKQLKNGKINAEQLIDEAKKIHQGAIDDDLAMANYGNAVLTTGNVLTHCNAGALATCGIGTALGVIRAGFSTQKIQTVYADETRPWLQGARLTAWELIKDNIPTTLICEGAAASLMQAGKLEWIIVGADRVAANGDVANKIGTYSLAVLAKHHGVKFMVVAPLSTIDMDTETGQEIPIEQRAAKEILSINNKQIAADKATAWNPVFDVTPAELVTVLVTNKGSIESPNKEKIATLFNFLS